MRYNNTNGNRTPELTLLNTHAHTHSSKTQNYSVLHCFYLHNFILQFSRKIHNEPLANWWWDPDSNESEAKKRKRRKKKRKKRNVKTVCSEIVCMDWWLKEHRSSTTAHPFTQKNETFLFYFISFFFLYSSLFFLFYSYPRRTRDSINITRISLFTKRNVILHDCCTCVDKRFPLNDFNTFFLFPFLFGSSWIIFFVEWNYFFFAATGCPICLFVAEKKWIVNTVHSKLYRFELRWLYEWEYRKASFEVVSGLALDCAPIYAMLSMLDLEFLFPYLPVYKNEWLTPGGIII